MPSILFDTAEYYLMDRSALSPCQVPILLWTGLPVGERKQNKAGRCLYMHLGQTARSSMQFYQVRPTLGRIFEMVCPITLNLAESIFFNWGPIMARPFPNNYEQTCDPCDPPDLKLRPLWTKAQGQGFGRSF